jgi:hypothetical protein
MDKEEDAMSQTHLNSTRRGQGAGARTRTTTRSAVDRYLPVRVELVIYTSGVVHGAIASTEMFVDTVKVAQGTGAVWDKNTYIQRDEE